MTRSAQETRSATKPTGHTRSETAEADASRARKRKGKRAAHVESDMSTRDRRWRALAGAYIYGGDGVPPFNATKAYQSVYTDSSPASADRAASRLLANVDFQAVLREVAETAWRRLEVTEREVMQGVAAAIVANVFDYFDEDSRGHLMQRPKSALTVWQQRNVKKLRVRSEVLKMDDKETLVAQTVELEIVDRLRALDLAARILSLFQTNIDDASMEHIAKLIAEGQERARRRSVAWDTEAGRPVFDDDDATLH